MHDSKCTFPLLFGGTTEVVTICNYKANLARALHSAASWVLLKSKIYYSISVTISTLLHNTLLLVSLMLKIRKKKCRNFFVVFPLKSDEEHDRFGCEMMISVTKAKNLRFSKTTEENVFFN